MNTEDFLNLLPNYTIRVNKNRLISALKAMTPNIITIECNTKDKTKINIKSPYEQISFKTEE